MIEKTTMSDSQQYGQFGTGCEHVCCAKGMPDLYVSCFGNGMRSTGLFFSRCCSVNTKEYPDDGFKIETSLWGYYRGGRPRLIELSKAAWEDNIVYQLERNQAGGRGSSGYRNRYPDENSVVDFARNFSDKQNTPIGFISDFNQGNNATKFLRPFIKQGSFEVRANVEDVAREGEVGNRRVPVLPLSGLVAVGQENLIVDKGFADGTVSCLVRITDGFERAAALFRFQDEQNHMRVLFQKEPTPLFAIQKVVNGNVTTIDSKPLPDRAFEIGNRSSGSYNKSDATILSIVYKNINVSFEGSSLTAQLLVYVNHLNNSMHEDINIVLTGNSDEFSDADDYGFYCSNPEVAVEFSCGPISEIPGKMFFSVYDDSEPKQLAEFELTSLAPEVTNTGNFIGTIVAGKESALLISFVGGSTIVSSRGSHCHLAYARTTFNLAAAKAWEVTKTESGWEFKNRYTTHKSKSYDRGDGVQFVASDYNLGLLAACFWAQHSYPLCAGILVKTIAIDDLGPADAPFEHLTRYRYRYCYQLVAGDTVWPEDDSLPYVEYSEEEEEEKGILLYTSDEKELNASLEFVPSEEYLRSFLPTNPQSPSTLFPFIKLFEATPTLDSFAVRWDDYLAEPGTAGVIGLKVSDEESATYKTFDWLGVSFFVVINQPLSAAYSPVSAVVAPGGKAAVVDHLISYGEDDTLNVGNYRFRIYSRPENQEDIEDDDAWIRFEHIGASYYSDEFQELPEKMRRTANSSSVVAVTSFSPIFCSDKYVYVCGPFMDHQQACETAGHELPEISPMYSEKGVTHNWKSFYWLISWDGVVRVPWIGKLPYDTQYRSKTEIGYSLFVVGTNAHTNMIERREQRFDCIKSSDLPYAPNYHLSEEQEVDFVRDFNNYLAYRFENIFSIQLIDAVQYGLGLQTWVVPPGCHKIEVECWGAGGGGAGGWGLRPFETPL